MLLMYSALDKQTYKLPNIVYADTAYYVYQILLIMMLYIDYW